MHGRTGSSDPTFCGLHTSLYTSCPSPQKIKSPVSRHLGLSASQSKPPRHPDPVTPRQSRARRVTSPTFAPQKNPPKKGGKDARACRAQPGGVFKADARERRSACKTRDREHVEKREEGVNRKRVTPRETAAKKSERAAGVWPAVTAWRPAGVMRHRRGRMRSCSWWSTRRPAQC